MGISLKCFYPEKIWLYWQTNTSVPLTEGSSAETSFRKSRENWTFLEKKNKILMFLKLRKLLGVRVWERRFNNGLFCRVKFVITWRFLIFIVFEVESETLNLEMHLHFLPQQLIIMPRNVHPLLKANFIINLMTLTPALSGGPRESILRWVIF